MSDIILVNKFLTMKNNTLFLSLLLALTCSPILFSCNSAVRGVGRKVIADQQLVLKNDIAGMKRWDTGDLGIQYELVDVGDTLTIKGVIQVKDNVRDAFPVSVDLKIYVYLVNEDGVATSRHVIRPNLSVYNTTPEFTSFSRQIIKDADTVSTAFSYWGTFRDRASSARDDVIEWEIFYSPFEK